MREYHRMGNEEPSIAQQLVERLYSVSGNHNNKGESIYSVKVGGCVITGNKDGAKHVAISLFYALQHIGYSIPPQADSAWLGENGPDQVILMNKLRPPIMISPIEIPRL